VFEKEEKRGIVEVRIITQMTMSSNPEIRGWKRVPQSAFLVRSQFGEQRAVILQLPTAGFAVRWAKHLPVDVQLRGKLGGKLVDQFAHESWAAPQQCLL
jgi:hypothetical protein